MGASSTSVTLILILWLRQCLQAVLLTLQNHLHHPQRHPQLNRHSHGTQAKFVLKGQVLELQGHHQHQVQVRVLCDGTDKPYNSLSMLGYRKQRFIHALIHIHPYHAVVSFHI